jgi:hypothetical protein
MLNHEDTKGTKIHQVLCATLPLCVLVFQLLNRGSKAQVCDATGVQ